jgi:CheY-like chemotaxis protein
MRSRILVVDDDWALCSLLQQLLESEGYEVETASNGQSAWEKLAPQPGIYAVVLIDIEMPRMNGLQLLRALKQLEADWVPPLLVMSANSEALQQAIGIGASHVLEKPFDLEVVLTLVATSLAWHW